MSLVHSDGVCSQSNGLVHMDLSKPGGHVYSVLATCSLGALDKLCVFVCVHSNYIELCISGVNTLIISECVFQVDGYPVYSMATPTTSGAKEMLAYLDARSIPKGDFAQKVMVTDLREEAVVYINGTPFVLRELDQPVDTLKHVGITGPVVGISATRLFY